MLQSKLFTKTTKEAPADEQSLNAQLLTRAGFVHKTMAGVYTFLPLGLRVLRKIEDIIREEMDKVGQEMLMPSLAPEINWEISGRKDTLSVLFAAKAANDLSTKTNNSSYILNPTHEEIITPIAQKYGLSYKDLPFAIYQIQTKFRNEARPKSGLLRGREFRMKDLYSFHTDEKDLRRFYEEMKDSYTEVFNRLGIGHDTYITIASGGDFTKDYSHEFQTECVTGEDEVHICDECHLGINKEVLAKQSSCPACGNKKLRMIKASEVGNIFPLNTKFSQAFNYYYTDLKGQPQIVYMGSYGIGPSRLLGVIAEKFADSKGLVWPKAIAPFKVHLLSLQKDKEAEAIYQKLTKAGVEVLFDDRDLGAGEKFADADLIGCPYRLVVSAKTLDQDSVELKERTETKSTLVKISQIIKELK
jgi:prolyl-tRNA synthetase